MLTALWLVPVLGALVVVAAPRPLARPVGLVASLVTLGSALAVAALFQSRHQGYQFEEYVP